MYTIYIEQSVSFRSKVKHLQSEVQQLLADKDAYEKKEIEIEKQSSDLRVQVIELRETKV